MRRIILLSALVAIPAGAADWIHPTVVELFTAQGCAACPPAQANINALAERADILPLSFAVTYWDERGWRDRFGQDAFTRRQRDYAATGHRAVATPQVLLNGRFAVVGNDRPALDQAIATADRGLRGPAITVAGRHVTIGAAPASGDAATVWLVRYDPRTITIAISAGENAGRALPHRNVVRRLEAIGRWDGRRHAYLVPRSPDPRWRSAILLQAGPGGAILAARSFDDQARTGGRSGKRRGTVSPSAASAIASAITP